MRQHAQFAILDCEDEPRWAGHEDRWLRPLSRSSERWDIFRVWASELPPSPEAYDGYVITGSHHSVNDPSQVWLGPLFRFVAACNKAAPDGPQILGACFGAQVLGRSLGGRVSENRSSRFIFGTEEIALHDPFHRAWFLPDSAPIIPRRSLRLLTSHGEHVCDLPTGAELLADSQRSPHEIFTVGRHALAVQGHAELSLADLTDNILPRLRERGRLSPQEEADAIASLACPVDSELVLRCMRRFLDGPTDRPAKV